MFVEKDAISGVVHPGCDMWDVALGVLRGFASETYAYSVAESLPRDRQNVIAHLGDHDPSGVMAWLDFTHKVARFAGPGMDIEFVRLAVTPEQITDMDLPLRPTKRSSHSKGWTGGSLEVDAIPAPVTRQLLDDFIGSYHDQHELDVLRATEDEERRLFMAVANLAGES